jgi:hypothetical protein
MQKLYLTDEETLALLDLLNATVQDHRYPVSPHIRTLRGTLKKLRPMAQVLEESKRVKAEAVGANAAELDRRELERELRSEPTRGELDRERLERELWRSGPEAAAAAWERVDAVLRVERAGLDRLRDELPADPFDAPSWASELCGTAARWWAWEAIRLRGEGDGGRTWAALKAAEADLRERLAPGRDGRGDPTHGGLMADCWTVALDLVLRELDEFVGAHGAAVAALYARARRSGIA